MHNTRELTRESTLQNKIGRNSPCSCGSGLKYKHCCLNANRAQSWFGNTAQAFKRRTRKKECLAPQQLHSACRGKVISAHTVSRSSLEKIAENGHVLSFVPSVSNLLKHGSAIKPQPQGVGRASTFTGFCEKHDNLIFSPLEKSSFIGSPIQCFLLAYRALARELHIKNAAADHNQRLTNLSKDLGPIGKLIQPRQDSFQLGTEIGFRDMLSHKSKFDDVLLHKKFDDIVAHIIELPNPPPVMCSGGVFPEHTLSGERIQRLAPPQESFSLICFSSFASSTGGIIVFSWLKEAAIEGFRFIQDLSTIPDHLVTAHFLRFVFESCENVHIRPSWWKELSTETKNAIVRHMDVTSELHGALRDYFSDDGVDYGCWPIRKRYSVNLTKSYP